METQNLLERNSKIFLGLTLAAIFIGLIHAASLTFLTDDAFISFRYAKNLIRGFGLVYNEGERVEGYTNFLWTILIAFGMKLGFEPMQFSLLMGNSFYLGTVALYAYLTWKLANNKLFPVIIPLTSLALCLHHDFNVYANGGLETAMVTFFISCSFATILLAHPSKKYFIAGFIFVLAMMTRPDAIVFLFASLLYVFLIEKNPLKSIGMLLAPVFLIFIPYWIWRYNYFGYFFPNSFYAKSIDLPYYGQGLTYVWLFFKSYYCFFLILPLGILLAWNQRQKLSSISVSQFFRNQSDLPQPLLLSLLNGLIFTIFIIRIGGDFMFARFFIPVIPFFYFAIELMINRINKQSIAMSLRAFIIVTTIFYYNLFQSVPFVGFVADEPQFYPDSQTKQARLLGEQIHHYFEGLAVRVAFSGGLARLIYFIDPPYALEALGGLTDTELAHQILAKRKRPGHEKGASLEFMRKKNIHFYFDISSSAPTDRDPRNLIYFSSFFGAIIRYDDAIMEPLSRNPEITFKQIQPLLDNYFQSNSALSYNDVSQDYSFFKEYYFDRNKDSLHEPMFLSLLKEKADSLSIR